MITVEQKKEISLLLNGKNLPLDLKLEILDHMMEQVDYKIGFEGKDFSNTINEINASWKPDFKMKKSFFANQARTKIHQETIRTTNMEILKKTFMYFLGYFLFSIFLFVFNKTISYYFLLILFISLVSATLIIFIFDFKTMWSCRETRDNEKISYLQKGTAKLYTSSALIFVFKAYNSNLNFDKYYSGLLDFIQTYSFNMDLIISFIIFNLAIFAWIQSVFYYLEYKKTLKYLEQKINFKL